MTEGVGGENGSRATSRVDALSKAHEEATRWIIFSDLHVSKRTMETCKEVLERVHAEAVEKKCGVLFLGDFWHARGAIPVARAAADPPELPPGTQLRSQGFFTVPKKLVSLDDPIANSSILHLPSMTTPSAFIFDTTVAS